MCEEDKKQRIEKRLLAVKKAYLHHCEESDLCKLHDVLLETEIVSAPSSEQVNALFMMLPADIIGLGVSWGFRDTEVGDEVFRFIQANRSEVLDKIQCITT